MRYGQYGRELLLDLQRGTGDTSRSSRPDAPLQLPPYNDVLVANCLQDLKLHVQALNDQVQAATMTATVLNQDADGHGNSTKPSMSVRPSIMLHKAAILRNKRCLLAYHVNRMRVFQDSYWKNQQSNNDDDDKITPHLSPAERDVLARYAQLVEQYGTQAGLPDLRAHLLPPSYQDYVQVRVVDASLDANGPICLESGATVQFTMHSVHYVLYADVEPYIRSGALQVLQGEEDKV